MGKGGGITAAGRALLVVEGEVQGAFRPGSLPWRLLREIGGGRALGREILYEAVWGVPYRPPSSDNALYVAIHRLRAQLEGSGVGLEPTAEGGYVLVGPEALELVEPSSVRAKPQAGASGLPPLPPSLGPLFGRGAALEAMARRLAEPRALLTLIGPPGVGKTHLALSFTQAAHEGAPWGPRVAFVELIPARDHGSTAAALLKGLGVQGPEGRGDALALAADRILSLGPVLMILDNAEHVLGPLEELLPELRRQAPELRCLVTSRERLAQRGEHLLEIRPLAQEDGIRLFIERGGRVRYGYAPEARERGEIQALVERLDRLPLAIALAAAQLDALTPGGILGRLGRRPSLRDRGGEARTLEETLRWSWDLLTPDEARLLARATVFAGPFELEDGEAVLEPEAPESPWAVDILHALRRKSLLQAEAKESGSLTFSLLESVRAFAAGFFAEDPGHETLLRRHGEWTLHRMETLHRATRGPRGIEASQAMGRCIPEGVAVMERFVGREPEWAVRGGSLLLRTSRGYQPGNLSERVGEVCLPLLSACAAPVQVDFLVTYARDQSSRRRPGVTSLLDRAQALAGDAPAQRAEVLYARAWDLMYVARRGEDALALLVEARGLAESAGHWWRVALCLEREGALLHWLGAPMKALGRLEAALVIYKEREAPFFMGAVLANIAAVERVLRRPSSLRRIEEAEAISEALGSARVLGAIRGNKANLLLEQGRPDLAVVSYRRAIETLRQQGQGNALLIHRSNLAVALIVLGRWEEGRLLLLGLISLRERGMFPSFVANLYNLVALCYLSDGRLEEARTAALRGLKVSPEEEGPSQTYDALFAAGWVALLRGELEQARGYAERCRAGFEDYPDALSLSRAQGLESVAMAALGEDGRGILASGIATLRALEERLLLGRFELWMGALHLLQGDGLKAREILKGAGGGEVGFNDPVAYGLARALAEALGEAPPAAPVDPLPEWGRGRQGWGYEAPLMARLLKG